MATKKQENQINKLYNKIKEFKLSQEVIDSINIRGFLYSVGRLNQLQIAVFLAAIARENTPLLLEEILDLLK